MTIYKLVQVSWDNGRKSDFDLPRIVGHYVKHDTAIRKMYECIERDSIDTPLSEIDFRVVRVEVVEN